MNNIYTWSHHRIHQSLVRGLKSFALVSPLLFATGPMRSWSIVRVEKNFSQVSSISSVEMPNRSQPSWTKSSSWSSLGDSFSTWDLNPQWAKQLIIVVDETSSQAIFIQFTASFLSTDFNIVFNVQFSSLVNRTKCETKSLRYFVLKLWMIPPSRGCVAAVVLGGR